MSQLFDLLDCVENISKEQLLAEIEMCKRRIMWCETFIKILEDTPCDVPKKQEVPKIKRVSARSPNRETIRQYMLQHGGSVKLTFLVQETGLSYKSVQNIVYLNKDIFVRVGVGLWSLVEQPEADNEQSV